MGLTAAATVSTFAATQPTTETLTKRTATRASRNLAAAEMEKHEYSNERQKHFCPKPENKSIKLNNPSLELWDLFYPKNILKFY